MFYLINKPPGLSSFAAIQDVKIKLGAQRIGHAGTLDPLATGLLLVATDEDTPLLHYADREEKTYEVTMQLGFTSDTYDVTGIVTLVEAKLPTTAAVISALNALTQVSTQIPPAHSAKRIKGRRAYALARAGKLVTLAPINIKVKSVAKIKMLDEAHYQFSITVSRGTYIRSLVHDVGQQLNCGALLSALHRSAIGEFTSDASLKEIPSRVVLPLTPLELADYRLLLTGQKMACTLKAGTYAIYQKDTVFIIAEVENGLIKARRVLRQEMDAR